MSAQTKWQTVLAIVDNSSLFCSGDSHKTGIIQDPPSDNSAKARSSLREFPLKPHHILVSQGWLTLRAVLPLNTGEGELGVEVLAELPSPLAVSM